jgi:hypothetical protein
MLQRVDSNETAVSCSQQVMGLTTTRPLPRQFSRIDEHKPCQGVGAACLEHDLVRGKYGDV